MPPCPSTSPEPERSSTTRQTSCRNDTWEIPGGGLGAGEDPPHTARREVKEEWDIDLVPGRLLVVDWVPEQADGRPPLGNHLFDGGLMSQDEAENRLRLHRDELAEWRLGWPPPPSGTPCSPRTWSAACTPARLHACTPARLHACSRALAEGSTIYLQHGFDPTRPEN